MKKTLLLFLTILMSWHSFGQGTPIITMIADGDETNGTPKVLEIYANGTVDFSNFKLQKQNNSNTTWSGNYYLTSLGTVTDGFVYVYKDEDLNGTSAFDANFPSVQASQKLNVGTSGIISFNGDDRIRIVDTSSGQDVVVDIYGEDGIRGTGLDWEYKDGYAKRNNSTGPDAVFDVNNWSVHKGDLNHHGAVQDGTTYESIIGLGTYTNATPCDVPENLSASNITDTSALLTWDPLGTEDTWNVEWGAQGFTQGQGTTVQATNTPQYALSGLTANTSYDFYVQADCGNSNTSTWAGPFTFTTTQAPCNVPTNLSASNIQATQADLSWTAGGSETAWNIEYGATGFAQGSGTTASASSNPYTLTGLTANTAYDFYVQADCGNSNTSTWAGPFSFTTAQPPCNVPTNLSASNIQATQADLSWTAGGSETAWNLEYGATGFAQGSGTTTSVSSNPYTLTGLTANTAYDFYVQADCGNSNTSTWAGPFSFTTAQAPCEVPTNLSASNITDTEALLTWDPVGTEDHWNVEWGAQGFTQGQGTTAQAANAPEYALTGLTENTAYDFYVQADCGNSNTSTWAGPYTFTTTAASTTPGCGDTFYDDGGPTGNYSANLGLSYTIYPDNAGDVVTVTFNSFEMETGYDSMMVYNGTDTSAPIFDSGSTFNRTTCPNGAWTGAVGSPYSADGESFTATNADGALTLVFTSDGTVQDAGWEAVVSCGPPPSCLTPTDLSASNVQATQADLSWTPGGNETAWHIEYGTTGFTQGQGTTVDVTNNPYTLTGLTPETSYDFYIQSDCGPDGTSTWAGPFTFTTTPTCPAPTNLSASNIQSDQADLSWTAGNSETAWNIEYGATGFTQGQGTTVNVTNNPYTLTGLTPATGYDIYVQADCGSGDASTWVGPYTFFTACLTETSFPYNYGFEDVTSNTGGNWDSSCWSADPQNTGSSAYSGPFRWTATDGTTPSSSTGPSGAHSGTQYAYTEASGSATGDVAQLISPIFDMSSLTTPQLSFYYHMYGADMGTLSVDTYDGTTWTNDVWTVSGQQQASSSDAWLMASVTISQNTTQFRFRAIRGAGYNSDFAVDDISIVDTTTCNPPSNLSASNILSDQADLSWTAGGSETAWNIEYGATGFTQGQGTTVNVTNNPYTLTGLTPATDYDFYVQADCGNSDTSTWAGPFSFTTAPASTTPGCGDTFYDDGGATGDYSPNLNITYTIYPDNAGDVVTVTFNSFNMEEGYDGVMIYDGIDTTAPLFDSGSTYNEITCPDGAWTGLAGDTYSADGKSFMATNTDGALTLVFTSDGTIQFAGWEVTVTCAPPPTCPAPTNLSVSNIQTDQADLSWTAGGSETAWNIEYGATGFTQGQGTTVNATTNPYTLTGLSPATTYDFYVQADCGNGDTSTWTGPYSFTTGCTSVALPYSNDFDNDFNCWKVEDTNGDNIIWHRGGFNSPAGCFDGSPDAVLFIFYNANEDMDDWLFSPAFDLTAGQNYTLEFSYSNDGGTTYPEDMDVFLSTGDNSTDAAAGMLLLSETGISGSCHSFSNTSITVPTTGTYYIAFHGKSTADQDVLIIDDFAFSETSGGTVADHQIEGVTYYPNPVDNTLNITAAQNIEVVRIYSITGQEVISTRPESTQTQINMSRLKNGVYFVKAQINGELTAFKVVKK